jgi:hypothetical protein
MKTNTARIREQQAAVVPLAPAQIIPFPGPLRAKVPVVAPLPAAHPSLGVNVMLALVLLLACLLWEMMVIPSSALVDAGHTAVTSPRALLDGKCGCGGYGVA